jgi:DNA-binding response OmpR family regulator
MAGATAALGYPRGMSERGVSEQHVPVILLVDDDPVITRLLEVNFRLVGFRVAAVSRGDVALERARAVPPSAVVLDVMLPGLGGYEVCRQMRLIPNLVDVPVVFLTARAPDEDLGSQAGLGPVDFVSKPFEPGDLVELVRRRVAERQSR